MHITKQKFVDFLSRALKDAGHFVTNCPEDADLEIVKTAVDMLTQSNIVVVADDTGILVLLLHYYKYYIISFYCILVP